MKHILFILFSIIMIACTQQNARQTKISEGLINETVSKLTQQSPELKTLIDKGVRQTAKLWQTSDGNETEFSQFCLENFIADPKLKEQNFLKISEYFEAISGNYNSMNLGLTWNTQIATGPLLPIDEQFAAYSPASHLSEDMYASKIAFFITLNFPEYSLDEKQKLGSDRLQWAYARLGDMFTHRVPAEINQKVAKVLADADNYVSAYNIYAGHLIDSAGQSLFDKDMILLSHWNLRDEIKADYAPSPTSLAKQRTIYQVMKRIINQDIPVEVINSGNYEWNPFSNEIYKNNEKITGTPEKSKRYEIFLENFHATSSIDQYTGTTAIERNFSHDMEVNVNDAEALFRRFLSAPQLKSVGKMVEQRLGRPLEAFDIWYDGFKLRSSLDEDRLSETTRRLYPDAQALKRDLPNILQKLGFSKERADYLSSKIDVDPARGSGHAWAASMKGQNSRLRTRIPEGGLDYKGYNIAIHEFGHNVEQTISLYDVDYYTMSGVPNTAFTEALAFVFQQRDLDILGIKNNSPEQEKMKTLDKVWNMYEITGVSLLDISVWKWLYANPKATAEELKTTVIRLAKEIWNEYYAPIFGIRDEEVLAVYSHMLSYPLYLSAYSYGQIIEFQLEHYLKGRHFANEVERIFRLGRLTPEQWILQATGQPLTVELMFEGI